MIILNLMNKSKKSIARKLAVRVSVVLAAAFLLLLLGAYFSLNREVRKKGEQYTKALVAVYADLIMYESHNLQRPVDVTFNDRYTFFGEYMCSWYRVDCIYAYMPDFEEGTITILSYTKNRKKFDDSPEDHMVGQTIKYTLTENEMRAWKDSTQYAVEDSELLDRSTRVSLRVSDEFGNMAMVGADMANDELKKDVVYGFHIVAAFMFIIIVLVAGLLYLFIRNMVSTPAKRISRAMKDYISGGKRSTIKLESDNNDEFSRIADSFNHMTEEMDKYIDDIARMGREQERQQAEVDIAADIQKGILPFNFAYLENCAIKAVMNPAKFIGGDLYDYLEIDGSHTLCVVGDVSGKGIPAAMLMSITLFSIRQFAKMGYSPAEILRGVNDLISEENPKMMFITAFVCLYNSETGTLTYANAGHNPPYLIRKEPVALDGSDGTPLGLFPGEEYENVVVPVQEGDSVFLYTDGVNEAVNEAGEFFGTERLEKVLTETSESSRKHYVEAVETALHEFTGDAEQYDDITMLSCFIRKRKVLELDYDIREFSAIKEYLFGSSIPKDMIMDLCVAAEECFVNICSYAFEGPAPQGEKILFELEYSNKVIMRFSDGGRQFDPRVNLPDTEEYDIDTAVGGLGRLIAFTVADSVDYEYRDGRNILTITKSIK